MWATPHSSQARKPRQPQPAEIGDRRLAADRGEIAEIAVAERRRALPCRPIRALIELRRHRRPAAWPPGATPGTGLPSASRTRPCRRSRRSPDGPARRGRARPGRAPPGRFSAPSHLAAGDAATPAAQSTVRGLDPLAADRRRRRRRQRGHRRADAHLDAEPLERACALAGERSGKDGSTRGPASTRMTRASRGSMRAEIARQRALRQLGDRAGQLDAGRAAADDHEGQQAAPLGSSLGRSRPARRRAGCAGGSRSRPRSS